MAVVPQQSVHVKNLALYPLDEIEELLFELFLQVGPVSKVYVPHDKKDGTHKGYAFVEFLHEESVPYSCKMLHGIKLLGFYIGVNPAVLKSVAESEQSEETMQIANTITANDSDPNCDVPKSPPSRQSVQTTPTYSPNLFGPHFPLQPPPVPPVMPLGPPPLIQCQPPIPSMPVPPPIPPSMPVPPPFPPSIQGQPPPVLFPPLPPNFNQPLPSYHPSSFPFSFNIHHETIATPPLNMAQPPPNMSPAPPSCLPAPPNSYHGLPAPPDLYPGLPAPPNSYSGLPAPPSYSSSIPPTPNSFNTVATPTLSFTDDAPESIMQNQQHNDFSMNSRNPTPSLQQQCTTDTTMDNASSTASPSLIIESDIAELDSTSDTAVDTTITTTRLLTTDVNTNPFKEAAKLLVQMKNTNSNNNDMADTRHHQQHLLCDINEENSSHELLNGRIEHQDIELSHSDQLISGVEQCFQTRLQ